MLVIVIQIFCDGCGCKAPSSKLDNGLKAVLDGAQGAGWAIGTPADSEQLHTVCASCSAALDKMAAERLARNGMSA